MPAGRVVRGLGGRAPGRRRCSGTTGGTRRARGRWSRPIDPRREPRVLARELPLDATRRRRAAPRAKADGRTSRGCATPIPPTCASCSATARSAGSTSGPTRTSLRVWQAGVEEVRDVLDARLARCLTSRGRVGARHRHGPRNRRRDRGARSRRTAPRVHGVDRDTVDVGRLRSRWRRSSSGSARSTSSSTARAASCGQVGKPLEEVSDDDWRRGRRREPDEHVRLHAGGRPGHEGGRATGASSTSPPAPGGASASPGIQAYASAKAGQIGFTRQTAHELGRFGITVNCIAPGFVLSNPTSIRQWESYGEEGQRAAARADRDAAARDARGHRERRALLRRRGVVAGSPARCSRSTAATPSSERPDGVVGVRSLDGCPGRVRYLGSCPRRARSLSVKEPGVRTRVAIATPRLSPSVAVTFGTSAPRPRSASAGTAQTPKRGGDAHESRAHRGLAVVRQDERLPERVDLADSADQRAALHVHAGRQGRQAVAGDRATRSRTDGKTYTFKLRQGVRFSNGKPMTAADVKFSIDDARAQAKGWGYLDAAIKNVQAPNKYTVVINLKYRWAPFLADIALFANGIIPKNFAGQKRAEFYKHPIGTGPFMWDKRVVGQSVTLQAQSRTTGRRASRTSTGSRGRTSPTRTRASCSSAAARSRSTSSRRSTRSRSSRARPG